MCCLCSRLLASQCVIWEYVCRNLIKGFWVCWGPLHVLLYVAQGKWELWGGTGGEHLDCCHLLLVSISTHCLVLDSDLAWKWDLEGGQCWWQGQGCRHAWHKVGDVVHCERRQERWFEWEDQELCFSFVEYEQGDDYLKEDVWETGWNCSLARSRLI